jgi:small-conductance mechanosensitive channel
MLSANRVVTPLRILLVLAFVFLLVMQVLSVPGDILHDLGRAPEAAHVLLPMLVVAELVILCFQIVIVCTWKLLTMVKTDRIFSEASLRWVDGIVWAFVAAWVLFGALAAYLTGIIYFTPELRDPGIPIVLFGIVLIGAVLVMLMVVLRALLRQATTLRTDMEAVI